MLLLGIFFSIIGNAGAANTQPITEGRLPMIKQISTSSTTEVDRLKKEGYVIVAMAHFLPDEAFTYTLERGSEWSRLLGSR